jgi:hypothetical protein
MMKPHEVIVIPSKVIETEAHISKILQIGVYEFILNFQSLEQLDNGQKLLLFAFQFLLSSIICIILVDPHLKLSIFIDSHHIGC